MTGGERVLAEEYPQAYYVTPAIAEMPAQTEIVAEETAACLTGSALPTTTYCVSVGSPHPNSGEIGPMNLNIVDPAPDPHP